jgi:HEAT repeat protein
VTRTAGAEIIKKGATDKTFPADEKRAEDDARKTEQLINTWREAIVIKDKQNIEKLGIAVNGAGAEAVPFLQKLALSDDNERVRAFAARVLGRMRKAEFAQMFRDLLEKDTSPFVRENAAWALGELKDAPSIDKLRIVADNDASEQVRAQAKKSVDNIKASNK